MLKQIGKSAYKLQLSRKFKGVHDVINVSLLKPYSPDKAFLSPIDPVFVGKDKEFEVEGIVRNKTCYWKLLF